MIYNTRSRNFNYHQAMNVMLLWDHSVPKRLVQCLNRLVFSSSYAFQSRAVESLGKDSNKLSIICVNDNTKVKVLGYDNFNWVSRAWEVSSEHGDITHNEVSAILFVTHIPKGPDTLTASQYTDLHRFEECAGGRHKIPADKALTAIVPSSKDQMEFRNNAILHVARILCKFPL